MQVLTAPASFGHSDCERIVVGALAQPVLAVTSLAHLAAGMAVLSWAVRVRAPLAGAGGVALVAVGAGSFAYHGPQPSWAKLAHDWPIVAAGAVYAAGLARSERRQRWSAWATPAGVFALGAAATGLFAPYSRVGHWTAGCDRIRNQCCLGASGHKSLRGKWISVPTSAILAATPWRSRAQTRLVFSNIWGHAVTNIRNA